MDRKSTKGVRIVKFMNQEAVYNPFDKRLDIIGNTNATNGWSKNILSAEPKIRNRFAVTAKPLETQLMLGYQEEGGHEVSKGGVSLGYRHMATGDEKVNHELMIGCGGQLWIYHLDSINVW